MRVKELVAFIKEREAIRVKKEAGKPRDQWTKDPILGKYRFCNVGRYDDKVTKWVHKYWLRPMAGEEDLWFAMVVARLFNLPVTLDLIQHVVLPFKPDLIRKLLKKARERQAIFNGAYIVSTNGKAMDKVDYLIDLVLKPLWKDRASIRPHKLDTLESWHQKLMMYDGLGSFMAAQVVADMKYAEPLSGAGDWWTFAASGPGSRRGLNRVVGNAADQSWKEGDWRSILGVLRMAVNGSLPEAFGERLHAQDLQNCLCEFDKYERARLGEGTPKQIYKEEKTK